MVDAGVLERLVYREVGVMELHVLADEGDLDLAGARSADALRQLEPLAEVASTVRQLSFSQTSLSNPCAWRAEGTRYRSETS